MENKENAGTTLLFEDSLPDWYDGKRTSSTVYFSWSPDTIPATAPRPMPSLSR